MAEVIAAEALRNLRERHGLTQRDVARICKTTERTIQRWESAPGAPSCREIPPTAWLLIRAAVGEYNPRIPRPLKRKKPGPKPRPKPKPAPVAAAPVAPEPEPDMPLDPPVRAPVAAASPAPRHPGHSPLGPRASLGLAVDASPRSKKVGPEELERLRRLAQSSR